VTFIIYPPLRWQEIGGFPRIEEERLNLARSAEKKLIIIYIGAFACFLPELIPFYNVWFATRAAGLGFL